MKRVLGDNKRSLLTVLGVAMLVLVVARVTYALFEANANRENAVSGDTCFSIKYTKGQNISGELEMGASYTTGKSTDIVIGLDNSSSNANRCSNIIGKGTIYLTTTSSNLDYTKTNIPLRYSVVVGSTVKATGAINGTENQVLYGNFDVTATSVTYKVYIWYDRSKDDINDFSDITFAGYIHASVVGKSTITS